MIATMIRHGSPPTDISLFSPETRFEFCDVLFTDISYKPVHQLLKSPEVAHVFLATVTPASATLQNLPPLGSFLCILMGSTRLRPIHQANDP